jgi:protein-L-isoaspartate(D-aspartate) O-methyltransferase
MVQPIQLDDSKLRMRRVNMVERQLRGRHIVDQRVLEAMNAVPRHLFVPSEERDHAYDDNALPIGFGQTISQPFMVALMLEAMQLSGSEKVLEVGTGSGYQAALLGQLASEVYSLEIVPELAAGARAVIEQLGFGNVKVIWGDGHQGLPDHAPYAAIVVAAGAREVPPELVEQLADGGVMLVPVGERDSQELLRLQKRVSGVTAEQITRCAFVPLVTNGERVREHVGH